MIIINIGLILSLLGLISAFYIGVYYNKMEVDAFLASIFIVFVIECFALFFIIRDVEKCTLLDFEKGNIGYKVTEISVEYNKATDIEVIHNLNNN